MADTARYSDRLKLYVATYALQLSFTIIVFSERVFWWSGGQIRVYHDVLSGLVPVLSIAFQGLGMIKNNMLTPLVPMF